MGLLDEAIRDHLELKRRRGADPTEVAREEREALEPVFPGERAAAEPAVSEPATEAPDEPPAERPQDVPSDTPADEDTAAEPPHDPEAAVGDFSTVGQETAELDMEAFMEQEPPGAAEPMRAGHEEDDELLEWDEPARHTEPPPEPIPGQERLSLE